MGGWVANTYIVMPLRGPTCKIARFQAELKFQVGPSVAILTYLHNGILPDTFQIPSIHIPDISEAFQTPYITFQIPYRHPSDLYIAL